MAYTNTYTRINWQNLPSEATALNDVNLNKMDAEIYAHGEQFETVDTAITNINASLANKVDKEEGKGLSAVKSITISPSVNTGTKIAEISYKNQDNLTIGYEIKNGVVVDSALSSSSENPVQNKVVKSAIDAKSTVSISDTLVTGDTIANLTINGTTTAIKAPLVEVDDTPSATSENPLQNKAIYEMLNNLLPEETVQGNPISISDASGLNAKACSVDLLPIQNLHGYDSPWAGGAGKNKYSVMIGRDSFTNNQGATHTSDDDVLTINCGTSSSSGVYSSASSAIRPVISSMEGPFTYSFDIKASANTDVLCGYENNGAKAVAVTTSWQRVEITRSSAPTSVSNFIAYNRSGSAVTIYIKDFMIENGSTAHAYEPYENICPISGRNSVEVKRTGKNLCNPADIYVFNSNRYFATTNYSTRPSIQVAPNTQYILSCRKGVAPGDYLIYYWDREGELINRQKVNPFTTPSNCVGISFYCGYSDGDFTDGENVKAQVEEGSTATAYEPYQGETVTVQLGQTVYGGTLDVTNGKLTITHKSIDLGDMTFTHKTDGGTYNPNYFLVTPKQTDHKPVADNEINYLCSYYKSAKYYDFNRENLDGSILFSGAYNNLVVIDTRFTDGALIKAELVGQRLCYELATPIEITLTAEQISLLKGKNVISTDGDNINLVYSADIGLYIAGQLQNS